MAKALKFRASKVEYVSPKQLKIEGFETPFTAHLNAENRWVVLAGKVPWDELVGVYSSGLRNGQTGADAINPRVAIGALIIKHIYDLTDRGLSYKSVKICICNTLLATRVLPMKSPLMPACLWVYANGWT